MAFLAGCLYLIFTTTNSFDQAYADWSDWQILNFPGIRPFSITSLVGVQPIKLTLYTQQNLERQIRDIIFTIEVSHGSLTTLGSEAQKWIADGAAVGERTSKVETLAPSEIDSFNRNESFGDDYELDDQFDDDDKYEEDLVDADAIAELVDPETSCYLLSGTSVSLREGAGHYVASGGGYAVLQSGRASIVMEKFQPKSKKGTSCSSAVIIRSGDVVRVQLVDVTSKAVKFLAIHRGWWLRWSSARPKRNGLFCVHTGEPNGSPVLLGSPFSLTSLRWSHYTVGACFDSSVKYGGRMLGIFKTGRVSANDEMGYGEEYESEIRDSEIRDDIDVPELLAIEKDKRMMPLLLRAESWACFPPELSPSKVLIQEARLGRTLRNDDDISAVPVLESLPTVPKHVEVDIPVWLEIMNRTKRTKQLVYAVRFKEAVSIKSTESTQSSGTITNSGDDNLPHSPTYRMSLKLLTGRELAHMLQLGVEQKSDLSPTPDLWQQRYVLIDFILVPYSDNETHFIPDPSFYNILSFDFDNRDELNDADSFISSSDDSDSDDDLDEDGHDDLHNHHFLIAGPNHTVNGTIPSGQEDFVTVVSGDRVHDTETHGIPSDQENSTNSAVEDGIAGRSKNSCEAESSVDYSRLIDTKHQIGEDDIDQQCSIGSKKKSKVKHAAVIGRVAKTVKASTVITGKHVIKQSMNITKGTVSAGRAAGRVIPVSSVVYSKPPRKHEPGEC